MRNEASHQPSIRPYDSSDLDVVVDLWYASWHAAFPDLRHHEPRVEWRRRFEQEIAAEERVFVAEVDGMVAGFLALRDEGGGRGYLHEIFVAPGQQHRGVG